MTNDTIAAVATPPGHGAIILIRLSGPDALRIADLHWKGKPLSSCPSHTAHFGYIMPQGSTPDTLPIDQAVATIFRAPRTFTGEDIVEFGIHGSPLIARNVLQTLTDSGARPAGPGEFSRRAVANGRMTLMQAEASADLIAATSHAARRLAITQMRGSAQSLLSSMTADLLHLASMLELELDFSEEDVEFAPRAELLTTARNIRTHIDSLIDSFATGQAIKDGIPVAITGPTNAGKSSLLNAILGEERAIVSDIHGTTRDIIEDTLTDGEYLFRLRDTAGLRDTTDPIERLGIEASRKALRQARIILHVADATAPMPHTLIAEAIAVNPQAKHLLLKNKTDLPAARTAQEESIETIDISAKTGKGIQELKQRLNEIAAEDEARAGDLLLTNARHRACLTQARNALDRAIHLLTQSESPNPRTPAREIATPDIIAQAIRESTDALSELTGEALTTPSLLQNIFTNFCIGK